MNQLALTTAGFPIGSLDAYITQVNRIPLLSLEEEQQFAARLREVGDVDSARRLVLAHLRYVVRVARGYLGYGLPLEDLIQEGNVGLMKAVKRFDPSLGVRLVSFAVHWIKAEIHEFILRNWRIVRVATTKAQRKLFFKLRQQKRRLGWFTPEEIQAVSQDLGVPQAEVARMEERLNAVDVAFDAPEARDDDEHGTRWVPADYLAADSSSSDPAYLLEQVRGESDDKERLFYALSQLDARSQDILAQRWSSDRKVTLQDLAAQYQVSAERVRQLEQQALKKLKHLLSTN